MRTHATGRRSSSPARRETLPAARSSFDPGSPQREPRDFDTWLHNAEAFGHHFADLPAPRSQPVQRKPDESASPYALPPGVPLNALRTSFGPEPIQGFGIPEWMKRVGRGIGGAVGGLARGVGGLARGAWNLVSSPFRRGNNRPPAPAVEDQQPLIAQDVPEPEPEAPPEELPALLPPPPAFDNGIGIGPLPPAPSLAASSSPSSRPEIVPPSFEELQQQRARWESQTRRRRGAAAAEDSSSSSDEEIDEGALRATARANSDRLSGHGRQAHGRKGRSRPASQVASNTERSRRRAEERTVAAAASRARRDRGDEKDT